MNRVVDIFRGKSKRLEKEKDPVDTFCKTVGKKGDIIVATASEVTDFSSQYGSENSISYTACNLAGKGTIYPSYGDFTQACVFRTYGPWWDMVPSRREPFQRTPPSFCSQDYIELSFEKKVFPIKLEIYETYNPGCVVRILACERSDDTDVDTGHKLNRWKTLWEGEPTQPGLTSRMFCPSLRKCPFPTDLIRLELCHRLVHYYTELDYVLLYGSMTSPATEGDGMMDTQCVVTDSGGDHLTNVTSAMQQLSINPKEGSPEKVVTSLDTGQQEVGMACSDHASGLDLERQASEGDVCIESDNGYFDQLPAEVIQLVLSFLDVLSLCRVARTCRLLQKHSYDPLEYTELNLQPHWTQVNDMALDTLQGRSRYLQRLNLSWCHANIVSSNAFCRYINSCGHNLRCLFLSSCSFVKTESIQHITTTCPNLTELDLDSCREIECYGFKYIENLKYLRRLNLYRTLIDSIAMSAIARSCEELRHLNLGSCNCIHNFDAILEDLGNHCRHLVSLDVWRSKTVSHVGLSFIYKGCPDLEELDLGWCSDVKSITNCIVELVQRCNKLKKLFLTANRTVCDTDLKAISHHCRDLEQLDILGTRQVTVAAVDGVLQNCTKMKFFDVSFCSDIDAETVAHFSEIYPHVAIKKSFQN